MILLVFLLLGFSHGQGQIKNLFGFCGFFVRVASYFAFFNYRHLLSLIILLVINDLSSLSTSPFTLKLIRLTINPFKFNKGHFVLSTTCNLPRLQ